MSRYLVTILFTLVVGLFMTIINIHVYDIFSDFFIGWVSAMAFSYAFDNYNRYFNV